MCGIIGILGSGPVAPLLVDALKRLEYRGYDSAGIATLEGGRLSRLRAKGKLINLEARLGGETFEGTSGIGHTRWATHGKPSEENAHPHATERVAIVHNGIIENYQQLREEIRAAGRSVSTETDTEVIAHLLTVALDRGLAPEAAMAETLQKLRGAFALAVMIEGEGDLMMAARRGSPLAIGYGAPSGSSPGDAPEDRQAMYVGSDAIALAPFTDEVTYLEDGDWAVIRRGSATIFDETGQQVARPVSRSMASAMMVDKGNHRHFMAKEINEQPEVLAHTLGKYIDFPNKRVNLPVGSKPDFSKLDRMVISACGTAYLAGLIAKYWFEKIARLPVDIDVASEFRYRETPLSSGGLALFISQSGETADTLAALRYCADNGQTIASIVNVPTSTIARESDLILSTLAGPEIGVASTKAFTCQLAVLFVLAVEAAVQRNVISAAEAEHLISSAIEVPRLASETLRTEGRIEALAKELAKAEDVLYLGRGTSFPLALEGALKLKEISYIHAEGYAAGELKHGPIALIDENLPVIVIAPHDALFEKTISNMQEVSARGGRIILITDRTGAAEIELPNMETIILPDMAPEIAPMVHAIPVQLIAYHTAVVMGTDVDQPRNLAKSVTVE